jgi:hypothetical protein
VTVFRLLPIFLVLLQSGLAVGHAHAHSSPTRHSEVPHLHICELLELFTPAHDHDHEGHDHDADAVDLTDLMASAPPPAIGLDALDLAPVDAGPTVKIAHDRRSHPLGLPPSTAGPRPPLYITLCSLTI